MEDDTRLRDELRFLEENYASQPPVIRQEDLEEINRIRSELGMPTVDDRELCGLPPDEHPEEVEAVREQAAEEEAVDPHVEAREIYQAYLRKLEELELHGGYADRVAEATEGHGMTPVRPLATMGTNGGPLLCDYCEKPIVLEGGEFHGVTADVAWQRRPNPPDDWASWILGGLVVEIQTNGTLRIYHGYPNQAQACCGRALAEDEAARARFDHSKRYEKKGLLVEFVRDEFPELDSREQRALVNKILSTLYEYDPGIGINRP
jgi:hypothetical protein